MAWSGMNDDEVSAQGNVLQQQAEAIQKLITRVDQEVESLKQNWQGDDSKQFEQEWTGTHRPELQRAEKLLTEMKSTIDREVQQHRETSSQYRSRTESVTSTELDGIVEVVNGAVSTINSNWGGSARAHAYERGW